ncbi:SDR family oxidoreductase [Sphingomonas sp. CGMCC 1.13654]|uniref:SDR family oxidoreductase n=1 Tax=Sphingomonas chungangi TaxID=2683589 RepID=A0A838L543_9SPHN|nr:SDR family oxidoreductase [Sphingomonas chungangi]MBA2933815.1 SDR family oxidoreductase [Sphingomonas chungangi]MVW55145.1 SDR family NAD(P)-dependent oxidoreductase [Sphingomonas chungangi]
MFDLSNRTILITGASSGVGKHLAGTLAGCGARLVLAARRTAMLAETQVGIEGAGGTAVSIAMDVADEASVIAGFDAAEAAIGPVDSVVANAGMTIGGSALGMAVEDFDRIFAVNARGVFLTAREAARRMIVQGAAERQHGRIVLISSVTAQYVQPNNPIYSASKAAVNQLGRTLARDWSGKGVNVNIVAPGYMRTELTDDWLDSDKAKALLATFPRRRLMDVDVLDPIVTYLCADASAQVTGGVFTIDDGQTL